GCAAPVVYGSYVRSPVTAGAVTGLRLRRCAMLVAPGFRLVGELRPRLGHDQLYRPAALVRRREREAAPHALFRKATIVVRGSDPPGPGLCFSAHHVTPASDNSRQLALFNLSRKINELC